MQGKNLGKRVLRQALVLSFIWAVCGAAAWAQELTLVPLVCFDAQPETFTRTLDHADATTIYLTQNVAPGFYRMVINPGGANQESLPVGTNGIDTNFLVTTGLQGVLSGQLLQAHAAGETVVLTTDGETVWGYNNPTDAPVTRPRGSDANKFVRGPLFYSEQPETFQPGVYGAVFRTKTISEVRPLDFSLDFAQAIILDRERQACVTITYQGRLSDAGVPANGSYDLQFQAFDTETGGRVQSGLITLDNVPVTNGVFTVPLRLGAALARNNNVRYLAIKVRPGSATGNDPFTTLTPRQALTPAPYAVNAQYAISAANATNAANAMNAATATNATNAATADHATNAATADHATNAATADHATNADNLGNIAANQYVVTTDARLSNERAPAAGSNNYIQNTTTEQTGNFNITGDGRAAGTLSGTIVNANTHFTIGGERVFGATRGTANNTFFGFNTGTLNTTGGQNVFVGETAGLSNTTGSSNTFVGVEAGRFHQTGNGNSYFGFGAGYSFGELLAGSNNTLIGASATVSVTNLTNATALGAGAVVGASNTVVLGRAADTVRVPGNGTIGGNLSVTGNVNTEAQYNIGGERAFSAVGGTVNNTFVGLRTGNATTGGANVFVGESAGTSNTTGNSNTLVGVEAGRFQETGNNNSYFGFRAGRGTSMAFAGSNNTLIGAGVIVGATNLTNATALGAGATVSASNTVVLGRSDDTVQVPGNLNVTGSVNTATQYNIGGNRAFTASASTANTFIGLQSGAGITGGTSNIFAGSEAGLSTNSGSRNAFFGTRAGRSNTTGTENSFFGFETGFANTSGLNNAFFGRTAGLNNRTGNENVFIGVNAGLSNESGSNNTLVGTAANVGANNLTNATALGSGAVVNTSNTVVLGRAADTVQVPGNLSVAGTITSTLGQSAATASGTTSLAVTSANTAYTLVPGLTQTVNVPANSSLLLSTDGGIYSQGALNTYSVVDVALFVDGTALSERRIVVSNAAVAASVENWALSHGLTLAAGTHTIEVRARYVAGQPALVSDASVGPLLRGKLTVAVIKN